MFRFGNEPLEPNAWLQALERIIKELEPGSGTALESLLRRTYHVIHLAPNAIRAMYVGNLSEDVFEDLLKASEHHAALALLISLGEIQVSHDRATDRFHVRARFGSSDGRSHPDGEDLGYACLRALLGAIIGLSEN